MENGRTIVQAPGPLAAGAAKANQFAWLDWIRFLAALTVVLVHARDASFVEYGSLAAGQRTPLVWMAYAFTRLGQESVIIFFVLSGFLVGGRALERIAAGTFRTLDYSIDRFTRIMLPLVPALLLTAVVAVITGMGFDLPQFGGNLLSLQGVFCASYGGNAPLWSLSYEVWFYVLAGAVGFLALGRRWRPIPAALVVLVCIFFTRLNPVYLFCWFFGVLAYVRRPGKISLGWVLAAGALALYGITTVQLNKASGSVPVESYRFLVPSYSIGKLLLAAAMAILFQQVILLKPARPWSMDLDAAGTRLAACSYTLYLTHYPILMAMQHFGLPRADKVGPASVGIYALAVAGCLIGAWLIYWPFEKRTALLRGWIKRRLARGAALPKPAIASEAQQ